MYRTAKNADSIIICIALDEGQSGNYPVGAPDQEKEGEWCEWTFEAIPEIPFVADLPEKSLRFKENADQNGIELRSEEEVIVSPNG